MKSIFFLCATFSIFASTRGQMTPVCYGVGECLMSVYLDDTPTMSVDECNDICQSTDFCQSWTLLMDEGLCFSFADCMEFDSDCENCYSGNRQCGDLPCNALGKCEGGREVDEAVLGSAAECHAMCVDNDECIWYTYDSDDDACVLLNNCPDVFTDCTTCVYGHRLCEDVGTTTITTTSTTTTTTADTSVGVYVVVKDATNGEYLEGVDVTIVGESTYSGTTDSEGRVDLGPLPVGSTADLTASLDGYADFMQTYTIPESGGIFINLSPEVAEGEFRGVMSWGVEPNDLDFHDMIFDGQTEECEVYYANKECGNVMLDIDNTQGGDEGPETITWTAPDEFTHLVYVYDYTGGGTSLYESSAHVTFYGPDGTQIDVDVPTDAGGERYWVVACIDGSVGYSSINVLNYLTHEEPSTVCEV